MLSVARRIVESDKFMRDGKFRGWEPMLMRGQDIYGKTLGIVGMGRIVAERALGFAMQVLYYDVNKLSEKEEKLLNAKYCELNDLLRQADFISLHTPLNKSTKKLIGRYEFSLMKRTAIFINTSRGQVVDEEAFVEVLKERKIAGAGLDVYEKEPEVHPELLKLNNVVLLPHIGSATIETRSRMSIIAAENIIKVLNNNIDAFIVNPDVWNRRKKA
jgi:glyoxylate reductase